MQRTRNPSYRGMAYAKPTRNAVKVRHNEPRIRVHTALEVVHDKFVYIRRKRTWTAWRSTCWMIHDFHPTEEDGVLNLRGWGFEPGPAGF